MRLIDADALIEEIANMDISEQSKIFSVNMLRMAPTAYNLDAVVEELENGGQKMAEAKSMKPYGESSPSCHRYYKAISVKKAIDMVRNGGKE